MAVTFYSHDESTSVVLDDPKSVKADRANKVMVKEVPYSDPVLVELGIGAMKVTITGYMTKSQRDDFDSLYKDYDKHPLKVSLVDVDSNLYWNKHEVVVVNFTTQWKNKSIVYSISMWG